MSARIEERNKSVYHVSFMFSCNHSSYTVTCAKPSIAQIEACI